MKFAILVLALSTGAAAAEPVDLRSNRLVNRTAYIPAQCYTKTEDAAGKVHNPCFTCHAESRAPHYINDDDLQTAYSFPAPALTNPWTNLFVDRNAAVARVSDAEILDWVRQDNYAALAPRLDALPEAWDGNANGRWDGFYPDAAFRFDAEGFDVDASGRPTGWRAFAYAPVNGTFWPTNGSTDDVLIRLPEAYRQSEDGREDRAVYRLNLAIVEALIHRKPVPIAPTDETLYGVDLDGDGRLAQALTVAFVWPPKAGRGMRYVGAARSLQDRGEAPIAAGLYPLGTEFLHSVRYIDFDAAGAVRLSARLKELRYMRKTRWQTYFDRQEGALAESKERRGFPDRIATFLGSAEEGISNGTGWRLQGFIEDASGALRPQSFEETVACMGCHGGVGTNDDDTFAFPRKLGAGTPADGWWHWSQRGYALPQPIRADGQPEYAHYLAQNGAGDELRGNMEVIRRYLDDAGGLRPEPVAALTADAAPLLTPSRERGLMLNKAYREIVREQSFVRGRDATVTVQQNVHRSVEQDQPTGVSVPVLPGYAERGR